MQLPASLSAQLPSWLHSSLQQLGSRSLTALALVPAGPAAASPRLPRWLQYSLLGLGAVVAASQLWWLGLRWRFGLPAPLLRPLLGINALLEMVMDPVGYWDRRAAHAHADRSGRGMSLDLLLGHPLIFVTDNKLSQKVFSDTQHFQIFTHPNARWLMKESNFIYYPPEKHKAVRRMMLTGLYEKSSLHSYVPVIENIFREHMQEISATGRHVDCMMRLRLMAARSSQESFVGPYLTVEQRKSLAEDMLVYTMGFLCLPLPFLPNSGLRKAMDALHRMHDMLEPVFISSMAYIKAGNEPRCVVDFWARDIQNKADEFLNDFFTTRHWSETLTDALFASQDATVSALCWAVDVLQRHPDELAACRAEIDRVQHEQGASDVSSVYTKLSYISDVAHEILRYRPPVPMLPHIARQDMDLQGTHVPAGTMVVASIEKAVPKRAFSPKTNKDKGFDETHTFGAGAHKCPGRFYAATSVAIFVALLAAEYDFEPLVQDAPDKLVYFPTLFPQQASFKFVPRQHKTNGFH